METAALEDLAQKLAEAGLESHAIELRAARDELAFLEAPPTLMGRLSARMRATAARQWRHAVGELKESRTAWSLIQRRMTGGESLTPEEADRVRSQVMDVLRVFPAGMIAFATVAMPVPGLALASPWVLQRLGLMPSKWREAHVLERLRREQRELAELGRDAAAETVAQVISEVEHDAARREEAARHEVLLHHWDADKNGAWDPTERAAYEQEVAKLKATAGAEPQRKRWFLQWNGHVVGPLRWTEVPQEGLDDLTLLCLDGDHGWVAWSDVVKPDGEPRS